MSERPHDDPVVRSVKWLRLQLANTAVRLFDCDIHWHDMGTDYDAARWNNGRSSLWIGSGPRGQHDERARQHRLHTEWYVRWRSSLGWSFELGGGDDNRDAEGHVLLPGVQWYWGFGPLPDSWLRRVLPGRDINWLQQGEPRTARIHESRELSLRWHSGAIWWMVWMNDHQWNSSDPKWRRNAWDPVDWLLGSEQYHKETLSTHAVKITLPEGAFDATINLNHCAWKRPRWPWARRMRLADVNLERPPKVPGNLESDFYAGDDAIYGMSCEARTVPEAVGRYIAAVLRDREHYGGNLNWQSSEVSA